MAKRSNTTFAKRQKEMARKARRQEKLERRQERKRLKAERPEGMVGELETSPEQEPEEATQQEAQTVGS